MMSWLDSLFKKDKLSKTLVKPGITPAFQFPTVEVHASQRSPQNSEAEFDLQSFEMESLAVESSLEVASSVEEAEALDPVLYEPSVESESSLVDGLELEQADVIEPAFQDEYESLVMESLPLTEDDSFLAPPFAVEDVAVAEPTAAEAVEEYSFLASPFTVEDVAVAEPTVAGFVEDTSFLASPFAVEGTVVDEFSVAGYYDAELPSTVELSPFLLEDSLAVLETSNQLHANLVLQDVEVIEQAMPSAIQQSLEASSVVDLNDLLLSMTSEPSVELPADTPRPEPEPLEYFQPLPEPLLKDTSSCTTAFAVELSASPLTESKPLVSPDYVTPVAEVWPNVSVVSEQLIELNHALLPSEPKVESMEQMASSAVVSEPHKSSPSPSSGGEVLFGDTEDGRLDATKWFSLESAELDNLLGFDVQDGSMNEGSAFHLDGFGEDSIEQLTQDALTAYNSLDLKKVAEALPPPSFNTLSKVTENLDQSLTALKHSGVVSEVVAPLPSQQEAVSSSALPVEPPSDVKRIPAVEHHTFKNYALPFQDLSMSQIHVLSEATLPGSRVKIYFVQIPHFYAILSIVYDQCRLLHTFADTEPLHSLDFQVQWSATGEQGDLYQLNFGKRIGLVEVSHQNKVTLVDYHSS
ncbi:MAG: hypothetical protein ACKO34_08490 [Vampirovibrionales bacterium]